MKQNFRIKVLNKKKTISNTLMHEKRRFLRKIRTIKIQNGCLVYIRVNYKVEKNINGKNKQFYNDGFYSNKTDLIRAAEAFAEI